MQPWRDPVTFQDKLLPDGSVERTYGDGRIEWRRRLPNSHVEWHDNSGARGVDEALGGGIIRRTFQTGRVLYGREQGHGRTAWSDGTLTYNRTQFGGRMGSILAGLGAGLLLGEIIAPPESVSAEEEAALQEAEAQRRVAEQGGGSNGGGSGGGDFSGDAGGTSAPNDQLESGGSDTSWDASSDDAWTGGLDDQAGMDDFGGGADLEDSFG